MPNQYTTGKAPPAVAIVHRDQIIERVRAGEYLATIADDLGITRQAISNAISGDDEYQHAREDGIERRLSQCERALSAADEQVSLARTRELLSHQRWRAEREFPARWGAKQQIEVQAPTFIIQLSPIGQAQIEAIEHDAVQPPLLPDSTV